MPLSWTFACATDAGPRRDENEDAVLVDAPVGLLVVVDGLGGRGVGSVVARLARDVIAARVRRDRRPSLVASDEAPLLVQAFEDADREVRRLRATSDATSGALAEATVALVDESGALVAHIGTTAAFHLARGELRRVTEEHSPRGLMIQGGHLPPEAGRQPGHRSVVFRAFGLGEDVVVDLHRVETSPGDALLLCSDGLYEALDDESLGRLLAADDVEDIAARMIEEAAARTGHDNVTVALARRDR